ncbi:MAG: 8-oxo-dGTP diphosphatase [Nanoarchaeota archaeon]|nr:8-oxo-dGTP diphosphatase [Nanoarchaeota archaeon]MBU1269965.1 8-oxo-dGTP diphosphatase [Nanoarchaeota archaeon]MBU1603805.1 8-oxo-dGTP diphosphatase [Nanoarchaeota archaeon]MBU2443180.1 8-oxo-dGTP diphosphatase [Nanoarchaeota archaeon]
MKRKTLTLCFVHEDDRILLAMKKRGFGAGRWNGYGGKVEEGEGIEESAKREVFEESSMNVRELERMAVIDFEFDDSVLTVHVFEALSYEGEAVETDEMKPKWFSKDEIPYDSMWDDDKLWLPLFIEKKKFLGYFRFDEKDKVVNHRIKLVESF